MWLPRNNEDGNEIHCREVVIGQTIPDGSVGFDHMRTTEVEALTVFSQSELADFGQVGLPRANPLCAGKAEEGVCAPWGADAAGRACLLAG